jgi:hypothetical protein
MARVAHGSPACSTGHERARVHEHARGARRASALQTAAAATHLRQHRTARHKACCAPARHSWVAGPARGPGWSDGSLHARRVLVERQCETTSRQREAQQQQRTTGCAPGARHTDTHATRACAHVCRVRQTAAMLALAQRMVERTARAGQRCHTHRHALHQRPALLLSRARRGHVRAHTCGVQGTVAQDGRMRSCLRPTHTHTCEVAVAPVLL